MGITGYKQLCKILGVYNDQELTFIENTGPIDLIVDLSILTFKVSKDAEQKARERCESYMVPQSSETLCFKYIRNIVFELDDDECEFLDDVKEFIDVYNQCIAEEIKTLFTAMTEHNPELRIFAAAEGASSLGVTDFENLEPSDIIVPFIEKYFGSVDLFIDHASCAKHNTQQSRRQIQSGINPTSYTRIPVYDAISNIPNVTIYHPTVETDYLVEALAKTHDKDRTCIVYTTDSDIICMSDGADHFVSLLNKHGFAKSYKIGPNTYGKHPLTANDWLAYGATHLHRVVLSAIIGNDYTKGIDNIGPKKGLEAIWCNPKLSIPREIAGCIANTNMYTIENVLEVFEEIVNTQSPDRQKTIIGAFLLLLIGPQIEFKHL